MFIDFGNTGGGVGPEGPMGPQGADGKSAYQVAVDNGYTGTEQEWLASLKGEKVKLQKKDYSIAQNGTTAIAPDPEFDGIFTGNIKVDVQPALQEKTVEITDNGTTEITPDDGNQGLTKVTVNAHFAGAIEYDWNNTGYSAEEAKEIDDAYLAQHQADIEYTRQIYNEWSPESNSLYYYDDQNLVYAPKVDTRNITTMSYCFNNCTNLQLVPMLNTSNVACMDYCFQGTQKLKTFPAFDTGKVTSMEGCFQNSWVETIPAWDFGNVLSMQNCFAQCYKLASIPKLNTFNVINMNNCFSSDQNLVTIEGLDTTNATNIANCFYYCSGLASIPALDVRNVTDMSYCFCGCNALYEIELKGGMRPDCNCEGVLSEIYNAGGVLYYTLPGDYTPILSQLPSNWRTMPLGEVPLKIRVLKDAAWLTGAQNLVIGGKELSYDGKGVYSGTCTFTRENPNSNADVMLDGVKIGTAKGILEEQIFEAGDNSSIITNKVGADILTIVPEGGNPDGWVYDEQVKGVKSAKISGDQSTTLKLSISGNFEMVYGQESEECCDYGKLLNGAGIEIISFQGKNTGPDGQEVFNGSTDDGIVQAVYRKDVSADNGLDAFWIKSIKCTAYPPYPEV